MGYRASAVLVLASAALLIGGCQSPGRTLTLTVEHAPTGDEYGQPVAAAHVRAVALDTNDVPLPVSFENLAKLDRPLVSGTTDERGRVRLTLRAEGPYLIEVNSPPFGALSDQGPWRWTLADDSRALVPVRTPTSQSGADSVSVFIGSRTRENAQ